MLIIINRFSEWPALSLQEVALQYVSTLPLGKVSCIYLEIAADLVIRVNTKDLYLLLSESIKKL